MSEWEENANLRGTSDLEDLHGARDDVLHSLLANATQEDRRDLTQGHGGLARSSCGGGVGGRLLLWRQAGHARKAGPLRGNSSRHEVWGLEWGGQRLQYCTYQG